MDREEAIKLLICEKACVEDVDGNIGGERVRQAYDMAIEALSADMVEVVRCKDCTHRTELPYVDKDTYEPIYDCGYNISAIWGEENGYCNHGERKNNGKML